MFKIDSSIIFLLALIIGIAFQPLAKLLNHFIEFFIILLLITSCQKINIQNILNEKNNKSYYLVATIFKLILLPIIIYLILVLVPFSISKDFIIGAVIVTSMPVAASAPAICLTVKGDFIKCQLTMVFSSVFTIFSFPLLMSSILNEHLSNSGFVIGYQLTLIIFPALIIGLIIKKNFTYISKKINNGIIGISTVLLSLIIVGSTNGIASMFIDVSLLSKSLLINIICTLIIFIGVLLFSKISKNKDLITPIVSFSIINIGLAVLIAHRWYSNNKEVLFYVSTAIIIFCILPFTISILSKILRKDF